MAEQVEVTELHNTDGQRLMKQKKSSCDSGQPSAWADSSNIRGNKREALRSSTADEGTMQRRGVEAPG